MESGSLNMKFKGIFPEKLYRENVNLNEYSSMKTGGIADVVFFPTCEDELLNIITELKNQNQPVRIFGNMGNVLFPDEGMRNPLIFTTKMCCKKSLQKCELFETKPNEIMIYAECGVSLTAFSLSACKNGYTGLEFAFGIPASVGGAIYMNAGAYGGETSDVIKFVKCIDPSTLNTNIISASECNFSYRHSVFMENNNIIVGGYYCLRKGDKNLITQTAFDYMQRRKDKQPLEYPSCGSAFKRPEGFFAGKLIEDCGLKGYSVGGAAVSEKHAGFVINKGGATTCDVIKLLEYVKDTVMENCSVVLEPEIRIIKDI